MKTIGLFGESPHDTNAIAQLLSSKYDKEFKFILLLPRITGSMLDAEITKEHLADEYEEKKPDFVIVVRDLDDFPSNATKFDRLNNFFKSINSVVEGKGIFLLNIYELEALLLSDINAFNRHYRITAQFSGDPMTVPEPKEVLKSFTASNKRRYTPGDCPVIFKVLNFDRLVENCLYFKSFVEVFESTALH